MGDAEPAVSAVGFTSQITAAFRAVEQQHSTQPIILDPLASHLGKAAMDTARKDWQQLVQLQGPGKSLRVPARNRLMDDLLVQSLQQLSHAHQHVQVVNIGCGMDSKPWRLQTPVKVTYFDIDQPAVMHIKQQLLSEARAATTTSKSSSQAPGDAGASSSVTGCGSQPAAQFPLLVDSWQPVAADLSQTSLASCLQSSGFDATVPCVWLAEALLYYLPLSQAVQLLADMRALSAPNSKLIATCIDRELLIADHELMAKDHYFHAMWHFSIDDLLDDDGLRQAGWQLDMQPRTTAELALDRYQRPTYVPLYGGAECMFSATMQPL